MSNNHNTMLLIHEFEKVMNKYVACEKKPMYYGTQKLLYRSEVHTIEAIGKNPGINVTELAQYLGITKGAVSQMIDKLIKKEMVIKKQFSNSEKEVSLELSSLGQLAYDGHEDYHKEFYDKISSILQTVPQKDIEVFLEIMKSLENLLDSK